MATILKLKTANRPPRTTPDKLRAASLERSRVILAHGVSPGLQGVKRKAAEAEYEVAVYRKKHSML